MITSAVAADGRTAAYESACALAPAPGRGEDETRYRLAESVLRHSQRLAADPARRGCHHARPRAVNGTLMPG